ncbi:MAG: hypothetical protein WCY11_13750, partial [Novosphingobium sp.]
MMVGLSPHRMAPPANAAPHHRRARQRRIPPHVWPAILLAYACFLPREFAIDLGGANLPPYRLALILLIPAIFKQFGNNSVKVLPFDLLAWFAAIWIFVALYAVNGLETAMVAGVAQGADIVLAYLIGRVSIRSGQDFKALFAAVLPVFIVTGLLLAIESIFHLAIVRPIAAVLTGQHMPELYHEMRFGLLRATGPFPHPILG